MSPTVCLTVVLLLLTGPHCLAEIWEKDMSKDVYIEASHEGFHKVQLSCEETSMKVVFELEEEHEGVIYTRGAFAEKKRNCFLDTHGGEIHGMMIPYDDCGVKEDENGFLSQTIILQQDDMLIFPGDLAFTLHCKSTPKGLVAKIGLADPDPSAKDLAKHKRSIVEGLGTVVFTPEDIRPRKKRKTAKDEL